MSRRITIGTIGILASILAGNAHAQNRSESIHELTAAVGISNSARSDRVVSPAVFDGRGWDALLRDRMPCFGVELVASLNGGVRSLAATTSSASESLYEGTIRIDVLQRERSSSRWPSLGVDAQITTSLTDHRYWDASSARKAFVYGAATLGPIARWSASAGGGIASATVTAPVIGMVVHPYSAVRAGHPIFEPRGVTSAALFAPNAELSFSTRARHHVSLFAGYHASATRYDSSLPVRGLTQSILLGVTRRTGSLR
jgi:hypothetical protein